jgi:DNA-binding PadR family transcriptional regulator
MARKLVELQNLTKSVNEAMILASLASGPKHGYQLALDIDQRSDGAFKFKHGTLYPILHKLERDGLIEGTWDATESARKRKSYALTRKGRKFAREQREAWRQFIHRFSDVVGISGQ